MSAAIVLLSIATAAAGCAASASASSTGTRASTVRRDSGVAGRVLYGPTCPVQRIGQSCTRPYRATITIRSWQTRRLIARVRSSRRGWFRVALAPGRYLLVPQAGKPYPRASPQTVTVRSHRYTEVTVDYDSGIR